MIYFSDINKSDVKKCFNVYKRADNQECGYLPFYIFWSKILVEKE